MTRFPAIQKMIDWFKKLPLKRKVLAIVLVTLLILISPWLYRHASWLYNSKVCAMNGGVLTRVGMARTPFCTYPYPDGGKTCHSSEECIGGCVIYEPPIRGQPTPSAGVCRYDNNPFVCEAPIEDPDFFVCPD